MTDSDAPASGPAPMQRPSIVAVRALALAIGLALAAPLAAADEDDKKQHVCVPASDGRSWICGAADNPPRAPVSEPAYSRPIEPPPFLADPNWVRRNRMGSSSASTAQVDAPATEPTEPTPEPSAQASVVAEPVSEQVSEPETASPSDPIVEPVASAEQTTEADEIPASSAEEHPVAPAVESAHEPQTAAQATVPAGMGDNESFLRLDESGFTVQLSTAPTPSDFAELVTALGIDPAQTHALRIAREDADWWLLVWSSHTSHAQARAALAQLPADAPLRAAWPRRIAPLQNEVRRAR